MNKTHPIHPALHPHLVEGYTTAINHFYAHKLEAGKRAEIEGHDVRFTTNQPRGVLFEFWPFGQRNRGFSEWMEPRRSPHGFACAV